MSKKAFSKLHPGETVSVPLYITLYFSPFATISCSRTGRVDIEEAQRLPPCPRIILPGSSTVAHQFITLRTNPHWSSWFLSHHTLGFGNPHYLCNYQPLVDSYWQERGLVTKTTNLHILTLPASAITDVLVAPKKRGRPRKNTPAATPAPPKESKRVRFSKTLTASQTDKPPSMVNPPAVPQGEATVVSGSEPGPSAQDASSRRTSIPPAILPASDPMPSSAWRRRISIKVLPPHPPSGSAGKSSKRRA